MKPLLGLFLLVQSNCFIRGSTQTEPGTKVVSLSSGCFQLHYKSQASLFHGGNQMETFLQQGDHVESLGISHLDQVYNVTLFDSAHFTASQLKKLGFQAGEATFVTNVTDSDTGELLTKLLQAANIVEDPTTAPSDC